METYVSPGPVVRGEIGLLKSDLALGERESIRTALTITTKPWDDNPAETIHAYREDPDYIWVPREWNPALRHGATDETSLGLPATFDLSKVQLDPERGQVAAIPAMLAYLLANYAGLLIAPTGTGKTLQGLVLGAKLGRCIGWPIYASHQEDNVREHAHLIGLSQSDIGIVRSDRCDLGKPLTIMYVQSLLARDYPPELYTQFGLLVADEVNRYGAPQWKATVAKFTARYRLGLTADPHRFDGLGPFITWLFGEIGYEVERIRSKNIQVPSVTSIRWRRTYALGSYCKWKKIAGEWRMGDGHPTKYDHQLAKDRERTTMFMQFAKTAALKGRRILVFSSLVDHLVEAREILMDLLDPVSPAERFARAAAPPLGLPTTSFYKAGMKKKADRDRAMDADVKFTTFAMARDAFNDPRLDTMFFITPPGNPLQPKGRLREKDEGYGRKPLMIIDGYEDTPYAADKYRKRRDYYRRDGLTVRQVERVPTGRMTI